MLEPRLAGICGSDVMQAFLHAAADNPLSAMVSAPHVMGHELVGTVLLVGVGTPRRYEWTPIFFREVTAIGSNAYGVEDFDGDRMHGFEHCLRLCAQGRLDPTRMITHRFPLERYREAFVAARAKERRRAVKVVFDFP